MVTKKKLAFIKLNRYIYIYKKKSYILKNYLTYSSKICSQRYE